MEFLSLCIYFCIPYLYLSLFIVAYLQLTIVFAPVCMYLYQVYEEPSSLFSMAVVILMSCLDDCVTTEGGGERSL